MANSKTAPERFSRSAIMEGYDQEKFSNMTVLVAGAGALGNWVGLALAGFGLKRIIIIDKDTVDVSNLNRQLAFSNKDINKTKAEALSKKIEERSNEDTEVTPYIMKIGPDTIGRVLDDEKIDVVFLCLDNIETRLDLNEYCVKRGIPMIYGGTAKGVEGMVCTIIPRVTPCLRCFVEPKKDKESCSNEKEPSIVGTSMLVSSLMLIEFQNLFMGKKTISPALKFINNREKPTGTIDVNDDGIIEEEKRKKESIPEPFYYFHYDKDPKCTVCSKKK